MVDQDQAASTWQPVDEDQAHVADTAAAKNHQLAPPGTPQPPPDKASVAAMAIQDPDSVEADSTHTPPDLINEDDASRAAQIQDIADSIEWNAGNNSPDFIAGNFEEACALRAAHSIVVTNAIVQAYEKVGGVSSWDCVHAVRCMMHNVACAAGGWCGIACIPYVFFLLAKL
jgi:hypothetical protein